jgi:YidC/Oxa1 family membrane protein insertase
MPILIAMFQFFPSAFELRQKAFLWSDDLSSYDSIFNLGFNIPFYGDHVSLFTLLMTVSTLVYTMYNNQMTGVTGQMKIISYLMPVMFLGFFNNYASGLTYYYFLSNLFTIGQQLLIRQFVDDSALHAQIQENKKKPVTKSKFQQKLEEMAKKRGFDTDKMGK